MSAMRPLVRQVTDISHIIWLIFLITATTPGTHATSDATTPGITEANTDAATNETTATVLAVHNTSSTTIPNTTQSSVDAVTFPETAMPTAPPVRDYRDATNTSPPAEITSAEEQANLRVYSPQILGFTAACVILTGIVGAVGNLLAALSLLNSRQLRQSPSTAFMVNLPACLLPVCVVGLPMFAAGCIQIQWYGRVLMPEWVCIFGFALGLTFSQVHLHTLCAIAFNRLVAVVWPAKYKQLMQAKVVKVYLGLLWIYSALLWLPLTFGGRLVYVPKELMVSMKDDSPRKTGKAFHVFLTYLLPIMLTSVCYIVMYFKVRQTRRRRPGARTKAGDEASLSDGTNVMRQWDDHVTRTILVLFVLLLVCSVPHLVIHVLHLHAKHPQTWLLLHVVFWLQFCLDPIIYVLMSQHYRLACLEYLQKVFPRMNTLRISSGSDRDIPKTDNSNQFLQGTKYEVRHSQRPDFGEDSKNPMLVPV